MTTRDKSRLDRRAFLQAGAIAAAAGATSRLGIGAALAADAKPLSFQLSWLKSIQYGGYFMGIENGNFAKAGIEPTFVSGGPNIDPVANVASGRSGIGDRPIGPLLVARDKGIPIKVIGTVFQKSPFAIMSLSKTPIRTVKELAGKTVACATSGRPMLMHLIKESGLDVSAVNIVPSSPDPSALVSGQIDAYAGYSTNQGVVLQQRGVDLVFIHVHDLGLPETTGTIYAREDFIAANRPLVVSFLRAARQSWRWTLDNPEQSAKLMVEKYGVSGLSYDAQLTEIKASKPFIDAGPVAQKGLLSLDLPLFAKIIDLYRSVGMIKSDIKVAELCDASLLEEAAQG
jgi:NitT/TauT family transport system substrate-binding protein